MNAAFESMTRDEGGFAEYVVDDIRIYYVSQPAEWPTMPVRGDGVYRAIRNNVGAWEEMSGLSLEDTLNGTSVDILGQLPPEYHMFRNTRANGEYGVEFSAREKAIKVECEPSAPVFPFLVAHGVGQAIADTEDPELFATSRSARSLLKATNVEVYRAMRTAQRKGWEFAWQQMQGFLKDNPDATYDRGRVREEIQALRSRGETLKGSSVHSIRKTLTRIGQAGVLLATNVLADQQDRPPTFEEFMEGR